MLSKVAGVDYVKIQKRNPDVCVPEHQKRKRRITPWGEMSYLEYKHRMEFSEEQIKELCTYSREFGLELFASVWDIDSAKLMSKYTRIAKLGTASITDHELCEVTSELFDFVIISTGMSTEEEIEAAVTAAKPDVIMHTNSTYPSHIDELKLEYINWLKDNNPNKEIGYSGHEFGLVTTMATIPMGVTWIERHVTTDRTLWGSDQMASVEPGGMMKLVKGIRDIESAMGGYGERVCLGNELDKRKSLRGG
jgi:N-acetylneuraminate synthase